jgi:penicillin-binding protein 2
MRPSAAATAQSFVDALNAQDFVSVFSLLTPEARAALKDADGLQREYAQVRQTTSALTMTAQLRGGLLQKGDGAAATIVSMWNSTLVGPFAITSTLPMSFDVAAGDWRVGWTRDAIIPSYANGTLVLVRGYPNRGNITAADGTPLAMQDERTSIGVHRGLIGDATQEQQMLDVLAQMTGLAPDEIKAKYGDQPEGWFSPVADVSEERIDAFAEQLDKLPMISARIRYVRQYPNPDIAPHVTGFVGFIPPERLDEFRARGFVGDERIGLTGVEAGADNVLGGQPGGELRLYANGELTVLARRDVQRGQDLTLTLSPTLQLDVQRLLGERRGAAVVLGAQDAAVLAMASAPTYSPTNVTDAAIQSGALLNRAVQGQYPAGSTFKMVTMAAGIGEGVTNPDDVFIDPGFWDGYGSDFRKTCWLRSGHGRITLQNGLTASCNIVFYETGKRLEDKSSALLPDYARKFGFGARTGVGLPEAAGVVPDPDWKQQTFGESWLGGDTVNLSVGQGYLLVTPLQIAQMTVAIANGGTLNRAHVIASLQDPSANPPAQLPLTQQTLDAIQQGMIGVTTNARYGTTYYRFSSLNAYVLDDGSVVDGRRLTASQRRAARKLVVAGKSGTAQAAGDAKPFAWFTAYVPADNPQIVVTVLLENVGEGSSYAAPLVRQIIEAYYGLPVSATPTDRRDAE